jgi:hypothetical protein
VGEASNAVRLAQQSQLFRVGLVLALGQYQEKAEGQCVLNLAEIARHEFVESLRHSCLQWELPQLECWVNLKQYGRVLQLRSSEAERLPGVKLLTD